MVTNTPVLYWHVRRVAAERGFASVSALHRAMQARFEDTIALSQFSAMLAEMPSRINSDVLAQLCVVLACDVGALLSIEDAAVDRAIPVLRGRPPRRRMPN